MLGLMDGGRDAGLGRRLYQWIAGIAARTDHHVRPELAQDGPGLPGGSRTRLAAEIRL